jgi:hypothetical protein
VFKPQANVAKWGLGFDVERGGKPADVDYSSKSGLTTTFQLKAGAQTIPSIPKGTAGVRLAFARQNAVAIALKGARHTRVSDVLALKRGLVDAVASRDPLPDGWFVVTEVMASDFASVVIAQARNASFAVSADADLAAGIVDLANANLSFTVAEQNEVGYRMLAQSGATPLFRGVRIKRSWLGKLKFEEVAGDRSDDQIESMFEPASPAAVDEQIAA